MIKINTLDKLSIFSKSEFERKFPLLAKYNFNEIVKKNALDNKDLIRKFNEYGESIKIYLFELDKRFDIETIRDIIVETIFKNPDEIMMSLITSYLNSKEEVKLNKSFITYFNKTSNFGKDSIEYMQKNGITVDRSYKNIPNLAIDFKYESLKSGEECFKEEFLDTIYKDLTYPERQYAITLIENNSYRLLDELFGKYNFNTKTLFKMLMNKGINEEIINEKFVSEFEEVMIMKLFCYMIESEYYENFIKNMVNLMKSKRYDIIKYIISNDLFDNLSELSIDIINSSDDDELKGILENNKISLVKREEAA